MQEMTDLVSVAPGKRIPLAPAHSLPLLTAPWLAIALCLAASVLTIVCLPLRAQSGSGTPLYSTADLGSGTVGTAINNSGTVVGYAVNSNGVGYPFSYGQGTLTNFTVPGIQGSSLASGINNQGVIVGSGYVNPNTTAQPYVSFIGSGGSFQIVSDPGGTTAISGINNNGVAAGGFALNYSNFYFDSFTYSGTTFTDLGACGTSWVNYALAINDAGTVVGSCSYPGQNHGATASSFSNGTFTLLGYLPGGNESDAVAINDEGIIVGWSTTASGATHAFSYSNGVMTDLGTLTGLTNSEANGINNSGEIVGYASDATGATSLAFVDLNGTLTDLNTVLSQPIGTTLTNAVALNDSGQIVALGSNGHTYLLSPTSIPPTVTFTGAPAAAPESSVFTVSATTNSGATPTITAAGACSISGNSVTMTAATGTCMLTATWPAQGSYLGATLTQSTAAEPPAPVITWATPAAITYGTELSGAQLDAAATYNGVKVAGTFTYTPAKGALLGAGTQTLSVLFTPNNAASFSPVTASVNLQVNQAVPKLIWNKPGALSYGTPLGSTQLDASASVPGVFIYSPAAGAILTAGVQVLTVSFTPTDTTDYQSVNTTVNLTVSKATPTVVVTATPSSITTVQPLSVSVTVGAVSQGAIPTGSILLTGGGYSSGAIALSAGAATIAIPAGSLKPDVDTLKVTYSPDANSTSYNSASGVTSVTVTAAPVAATPTFSPSGGAYSTAQAVSLLNTTPNAVLWFTTDGSTPVPGQGTAAQFTGAPIPVNVTTTIKAVATASGSTTSKVASATYTLKATAPTFSVPGGTYSIGQAVSLSDATPNAVLWYTTDGSTPVPGQGTAVQFAGVPIAVNVNTTIKAVAALSGWTTSSVASATYKFEKATMPANGLIGFWTGNNTAADSSPTANNGSFPGSYVPGRPGSGAAFNLATGIVTIPNNPAYDNFVNDPGWTVGFWFNTNGIAPNGGNDFFLGQDNGSGYQPKWFIDYGYTVFGPNQDFVWHVNDYNTERIFLTSNAESPVPSGWNQLTVVTDNVGRSVTFYLNGQSVGSDSLPTYVLETTAPLLFGEAEGSTFTGLMNDVAIYNRALSAQEVLTLLDSTR